MKIFGNWNLRFGLIQPYSDRDPQFLHVIIQRILKRIAAKISDRYRTIQDALFVCAIAIEERLQKMEERKVVGRQARPF